MATTHKLERGTLEVDTIDAPAYWASALINGDDSSFDASSAEDAARERAELDAFVSKLSNDGWSVVSTEDDSEAHIGRWNGLQTEMLTYVIHRHVK